MGILTFQMGKVCVLSNRFISSSKGICLLWLYTILPNFIKIGQEFFEIIEVNVHTHTHTHRHIHAGENNTCPKTKFLGQVIRKCTSCIFLSDSVDCWNHSVTCFYFLSDIYLAQLFHLPVVSKGNMEVFILGLVNL